MNKTATAVTAELARSAVHQRFDQLLDRMHRTFASKDRAYAGEAPLSNIRRSERIGVPASVACFIRMTDKFSRMESLIRLSKDPSVGAGDEGILDNAFDLAVYALIFMILKDEEAGLDIEQVVESTRFDDASRSFWKGSMVESLSSSPKSNSPGSAAAPTHHSSTPTLPRPVPATPSSASPAPSLAADSQSVDALAISLNRWFNDQFGHPNPLQWDDSDPVVKSAWRETAKHVYKHFGK